MPNTSVRAAAEGMPTINRRAAITAAAAMLAAASTVKAAPAAEISPELEKLIAAKDKACAAFDEALEASYEVEVAYFKAHRKELFVDLSIGGAQSFHPDFDRDFFHHDVRNDIIKRYEDQTRKLVGLEKINPAIAASAADALNSALIKDLRTFRQVLRDEIGRRRAFGYWQAEEAREEASQADLDAFTDLCAYRCANFAELARKAEVLAHYTGSRFAEIQAEDFQILLTSMMPVTAGEGGAS
ncbi:hypothetical protein [Mesorhizobium sp. M4B.F.Ca.ET.017.02.2.1]|uniref:hypothetical protein n=1 Tax=Mesorhizobium sp. M4B.F.Ca.ET.017.02.2.1 TaxID=2496649 RepID=UPI000FCC5A23|nr:hypothetical protein [Mesorhizobium sp. M4B.F.Ca.ET.017.02.2.1]RVD31407.1 hypothetical protein EN738_01765 [Mesorhizobium sp. M4B.F.Ca.ET.017.02.2.1]